MSGITDYLRGFLITIGELRNLATVLFALPAEGDINELLKITNLWSIQMKTTAIIPGSFLLLVATALPAHAAHPLLEGFTGSFIRAFVAYCALFVMSHLIAFMLTMLSPAREEGSSDDGEGG
ncbi:MAG TPA: hypothetical protein VIU40_02190 [Geobacteraceae bacterium]